MLWSEIPQDMKSKFFHHRRKLQHIARIQEVVKPHYITKQHDTAT
jgi:hypothetical protein